MKADELFEGYEIPMHQSITGVILAAGLPRTAAMALWIGTAAIAFGMRQIWILPLGIVFHVVIAACTRKDPHFFDIFIRALKSPKRLNP